MNETDLREASVNTAESAAPGGSAEESRSTGSFSQLRASKENQNSEGGTLAETEKIKKLGIQTCL
jgi:hypothetical protein